MLKHRKFILKQRTSAYCVCIPVINEGERIKIQLKNMKKYAKVVDIIIADGYGGSKDKSLDHKFLKSNNVRALLILDEPGKQGTQLRMAFRWALRQGYQGVIQMDGNNKDGVEAIPRFIKELDRDYDYIQGSRFIKGGQAINTPFPRTIGVRLIASPLISVAAGFWYTDVTNGFRAYSGRYLKNLKVKPFRNVFRGYEFNLYLTTRAKQLGLRTKEIPVLRKYPKNKVPTKIRKLGDNVDFFASIVKVVFRYYHP